MAIKKISTERPCFSRPTHRGRFCQQILNRKPNRRLVRAHPMVGLDSKNDKSLAWPHLSTAWRRPRALSAHNIPSAGVFASAPAIATRHGLDACIGARVLMLFPVVLLRGMSLDGVTYATIARNMAVGIGDFWHPYYTATLLHPFHEQPPLAFSLEGGSSPLGRPVVGRTVVFGAHGRAHHRRAGSHLAAIAGRLAVPAIFLVADPVLGRDAGLVLDLSPQLPGKHDGHVHGVGRVCFAAHRR